MAKKSLLGKATQMNEEDRQSLALALAMNDSGITTNLKYRNEFTSFADITSPDGILRSRDMDGYLENALKPLIDQGKVLKRVARGTRTRATRYSFQGGSKVKAAVQGILDNMPKVLGYPVDENGNIEGTNTPPPVSVQMGRKRRYVEMSGKILDPRTLAAIGADVERAGGSVDTEKETGLSTILLPSGSKRLVSNIQDRWKAGNQKYLAGELPSSALADGASTADIQQRAMAGELRRFKLKNARLEARERIIAENPGSPAALEYLAIQKKITNREEKARLLEAERTPGTKEFQAAINLGLYRNAARDEAEVKWAKKNRRDPLAKAILKRNRNKTAGGRAINKAMAAMRFGVIGVVLGTISMAVKAMVGFLSGLPALAENVRKMANKGASLGVTDEHLRNLEALEARLPGLEKGAVGNYLGSLQNNLADISTGGALSETVTKMAPLLSRAPSWNDLVKRTAEYSAGQYTDTNALGKDLLNAALVVSLQGQTFNREDLEPSEALRFNAVTIGRALGDDKIMNSFATALQNKELIPDTVLQQIINVAKGKDEEINGQFVDGGAALEAIIAAIMGKQDMLKPSDTATVVEWKAADEIAERWKDLAATFQEIKTGMLVTIASTLGGILSFVEYIAKAVLTLPIFGDRFSPIVQGLDERAYYRNAERIKTLEILNESANQYAAALGEKHGFIKTKKIGEDKESGFIRAQYPDGTVALTSAESYENSRQSELATMERKFWGNKESVPAEFVGKYDEYIEFMAALRNARVTGNELSFGRAQQEGQDNMGAPVEYMKINDKGEAVKETYTYKVGNVRELNYATPAQAAAQVQKDMYNAIGASNAQIENYEDQDNSLWDWFLSIKDDWYYKDLEKRDAKGERISPADYSKLEKWRNAKARYEQLGNDGMQMGNFRPEGQPDKNIPGEASVLAGRAVRQSTIGIAQWQTELEAIRVQAGNSIYHDVLEGNITVRGVIKAEDRTYTIVLKDAATGKERARVQDIQNVSGGFDMSNIWATLEAPISTPMKMGD